MNDNEINKGNTNNTPSGKTILMICKTCGGTLDLDEDHPILKCPFCGSKELILENDAVTIARIKSKTYKEIELERIKTNKELELERYKRNKEIEENRIHAEEVKKFSGGCASKVAIFIIALSLFTIVNYGGFARFLALSQFLLCVFSWLIGLRVIKTKIPGLQKICIIFAFLLMGPILRAGNTQLREIEEESKRAITYEWPTTGLLGMLPEPDSNNGTIKKNNATEGSAEILLCSEEQFDEYCKKCVERGFNDEIEHSTWRFYSYNAEYYYTEIKHYTDTMYIEIYPPKQYKPYRWGISDVAKSVPVPSGELGIINTDTYNCFNVLVADTSDDEFNDYIDSCVSAGFTQDYSRRNGYYHARNSKNYELTIEHMHDKAMRIIVEYDEKK